MPGALVAALLILSLVLVHFSARLNPMPSGRPLDVDYGLPFPEAGQISSVFSLTALFGAYFGIYLMLGLFALSGIAAGTVVGMIVVNHWIRDRRRRTFEEFLTAVRGRHGQNGSLLFLSIAGVQCAYAGSELLILRELGRSVLGIRSDLSVILAICTGLVGYFYVLFGGYLAVFRTDVLQFVMVALMAAALGLNAPAGEVTSWIGRWQPRPGYWVLPFVAGSVGMHLYHFLVGMVMGLAFILASPDAWKRIFLVTRIKSHPARRFPLFLLAALTPFALLVALGRTVPHVPDGDVNPGLAFGGLLSSASLFVAVSLGLIASFLSSFNSAVISAVQTGLILRRTRGTTKPETPVFHWLLVTVLLVVSCLFFALTSLGNPYVVGNVLLGPYAIIAGIMIGAGGSPSSVPDGSVLWIGATSVVAWLMYVMTNISGGAPSTFQINTVPIGVSLCLATGLVTFALRSVWRPGV
jgi:hypothetical protein